MCGSVKTLLLICVVEFLLEPLTRCVTGVSFRVMQVVKGEGDLMMGLGSLRDFGTLGAGEVNALTQLQSLHLRERVCVRKIE